MPTDVTNNFPIKEFQSWRHNTRVKYKDYLHIMEGQLELARATKNELMEVINAMRQERIDMRQQYENFMANAASEKTKNEQTMKPRFSSAMCNKPKKKKKEKTKDEYQQEGNENNPFKYYCWKHGCNNTHPSYACNKKDYPKFRTDATFTNRMGGLWKGSFDNCRRGAEGHTSVANNLNISSRITSVAPPVNQTPIIAKADSGATKTYFMPSHQHVLEKCTTPTITPTVVLPNKETLQPIAKGLLRLHPELSDKAQTATVLDNLRSASLISIRQLCDDNCVALFSKNNLQVYKNGNTCF